MMNKNDELCDKLDIIVREHNARSYIAVKRAHREFKKGLATFCASCIISAIFLTASFIAVGNEWFITGIILCCIPYVILDATNESLDKSIRRMKENDVK
ncbi:MAG: hypothetical protein ACRC1T_04835 [Clostridium chrysemydis]|uniref:hypothetical protein n=1 Tax=Clostridium chrysemydis TaxID=2665504 RepID=UPI003F3B1B35